MTRRWIRYNFITLYLLTFVYANIYSQTNCQLPILTSVTNPSLDGFDMSWLDFNSGSVSWEIEFGLSGFPRTEVPNITDIGIPTFQFTGLQAGRTYEVYIRANCQGAVSLYNGPYFVNTVIDNNASCNLSFPISDNNCPSEDQFLITETQLPGTRLGEDVFLESVDLIISHPWPADLSIGLKAPWGDVVNLSSNNGRGIDNYGDPSVVDCSLPVSFSDDACQEIGLSEPPLIGSFSPESALSSLNNGNDPSGNWAIVICDRASGDLGELNYVKLNFVSMSCNVPTSFRISDVEATQVEVSWDSNARCEALELVFKRAQDPIPLSSSDFVICEAGSFIINNLEPNQEYELTVEADCGNANFSPISCIMNFTTSCRNSRLVENFDDAVICESSCVRSCPLSGIWYNGIDDDADWIVSQGVTPTSFTGPQDDISGGGGYAYIESQPNICPEDQRIELFSDCLSVINADACALSIDYHMFGSDIGLLEVAYSTDELTWHTIFEQTGAVGMDWQNAQISLPTNFEIGRLRITATKLQDASRGDIAIDNLKLLSLDTTSARRYFGDADNDGFGDSNAVAFFCSDTAPPGFVSNDRDCNDANQFINPGVVEIRCNQIDENCNGDEDDVSLDDLGYNIEMVSNESCLGTGTGIIEITAQNGQPPYQYNWSNGNTGPRQANLLSDIYVATITDVGGCQIVTDPIFVGFEDILVYSVASLITPSCAGLSDGSIEILVEGGIAPLDVEWSNGDTGTMISNLEDGIYQATITDAFNCSLVIDDIVLNGPQILTVGVVLLQDSDCHQDNSGFIQLGIVGGTSPYNILWSNGATENVVSNLRAGLYSATITDANGCENIIEDLEISEPDALEISVTTLEKITCPGGDDSFVDIKIEGGSPPYAYFWSNGASSEDQFGIEAGTYQLTVSDFNSCSAILDNIVINEPDPIQISVSNIINVNCLGSTDGAVAVNVVGGNGNYIYNWGIFEGDDSDENSLDDLGPGLYSVTVVDEFNCKSNAFSLEVINEDTPIDVNITLAENVSCHGDSTGQLTAMVADATLPLDFNWSSGAKNVVDGLIDTIAQLISGSYNLTVTDEEGCVGVADSIIVNSPLPIVHTVGEKINNICWDDEEGSIALEVSGGQSPYDIVWSNGLEGVEVDGLETNIYEATITDELGCVSFVSPIAILAPDTLKFNASVIPEILTSSGEIQLEPVGGTPPYFYTWGNPISFVNGANATGLEAGKYTVTIEDAAGCTSDTLLIVTRSTSIAETGLYESVTVYPNPTEDKLYVHALDIPIANLAIFNLEGKLMQHISISNQNVMTNPITLYVSDFSPGLYILKIGISNQAIYRKIIVH